MLAIEPDHGPALSIKWRDCGVTSLTVTCSFSYRQAGYPPLRRLSKAASVPEPDRPLDTEQVLQTAQRLHARKRRVAITQSRPCACARNEAVDVAQHGGKEAQHGREGCDDCCMSDTGINDFGCGGAACRAQPAASNPIAPRSRPCRPCRMRFSDVKTMCQHS